MERYVRIKNPYEAKQGCLDIVPLIIGYQIPEPEFKKYIAKTLQLKYDLESMIVITLLGP